MDKHIYFLDSSDIETVPSADRDFSKGKKMKKKISLSVIRGQTLKKCITPSMKIR